MKLEWRGHPVDLVYHISPLIVLVLFPIGVMVEGTAIRDLDFSRVMQLLLVFVITSALAFGITLFEFLIVSATSSLTLNVVGLFKEIITICAAAVILKETLTEVNIWGLTLSIAGIAYYNSIKYRNVLTKGRDTHSHLAYEKLAVEIADSNTISSPRSPFLVEIATTKL